MNVWAIDPASKRCRRLSIRHSAAFDPGPSLWARTCTAALLLLVQAVVAATPPGERIILRVDANAADYCLYDGRLFSEGAYIESPRGVLVCTYREREAGTGKAYMPGPEGRRLKWLRTEPAVED